MSRRAQRPELEFGSDSFLDVVCNIVGILIILIVVVGVKVERQPKLTEQATAQASQRGVNQAQLLAERQRAFDLLRRDEQETVGQLQTLQTDDAQSQLLIQQTMEAQELARQQLESDQQQAERRRKQAADLEADRDAMAARVASLQKILKDKSQDNLKLGQRLARVSTSEKEFDEKLQATVIETQKLQEVLESAEQAARPTAKMQHRLSPVTKPAENAEVHFRVSNGRISEIPLEELLDRLKEQVLARRSTVMRFNQFDGVVGPVHGYVMNYTVEKEGPTTLEALQNGDGRTRVNVTRWKIDPDSSLTEETFDQAVRPGSRYRQRIETAVPDTVITMWIYPDSFSGFAPLREIAHGLQLRVAARPLPEGTPIVGSPSGSRSTAQ
jgi:hypothetical protein